MVLGLGLPGWLQHSQCLEILILNPLYYNLRRAGRPDSYTSVAGSRKTTGNRQWGHPEAIVFSLLPLFSPLLQPPASSGLPVLTGTHAPGESSAGLPPRAKMVTAAGAAWEGGNVQLLLPGTALPPLQPRAPPLPNSWVSDSQEHQSHTPQLSRWGPTCRFPQSPPSASLLAQQRAR